MDLETTLSANRFVRHPAAESSADWTREYRESQAGLTILPGFATLPNAINDDDINYDVAVATDYAWPKLWLSSPERTSFFDDAMTSPISDPDLETTVQRRPKVLARVSDGSSSGYVSSIRDRDSCRDHFQDGTIASGNNITGHNTLKWSQSDLNTLKELKRDGKKWIHIARSLNNGKSANACRKMYQKTERTAFTWTDELDTLLKREYNVYAPHMWQLVASTLGVPWRTVELRAINLGLLTAPFD